MSQFSNRISQRRTELGLTQEGLAHLAGTSQKQISNYENDGDQPRAGVLGKLADALNTTSDYLLGRTDNPDRPLRDDEDLEPVERELITLIRKQSPEQRERIVNAVKALAG